MRRRGRHLDIIDTLRGVAALSVCLFHYTGKVLPKVHVDFLETGFSWGWAGADVFFVVSGFIIPYVLFKSSHTVKNFWHFIGKRFIRICPFSYIVILLTLLQWWLYDRFFHTDHTYLTEVSLKQVLHNITYTASFFNYAWLNGVFWTLAVEFQFYILIGLFFNLSFKNIYTFLAFYILVLSCHWLPIPQTELFFKWGSLFLMGYLTMFFFAERLSVKLYLILLTVLSIAGYFQLGFIAVMSGTITSLLIAFVSFKSAAGTFLGKISYSLYLIHILCAPVFEIALIKIMPVGSVPAKTGMQLLILLLTLGCSYIFYLVVDRYFINLAHKVFRHKNNLKVQGDYQQISKTAAMSDR